VVEFLKERSEFRLFTLAAALELQNEQNRFYRPIVLHERPPDVFDFVELREPTTPQDISFLWFDLQADQHQGFVASQDKFAGILEFLGDVLMDWREPGSNSFFRLLVRLELYEAEKGIKLTKNIPVYFNNNFLIIIIKSS